MGLAMTLIVFFHSERLQVIVKIQDFWDIGVDIFPLFGCVYLYGFICEICRSASQGNLGIIADSCGIYLLF